MGIQRLAVVAGLALFLGSAPAHAQLPVPDLLDPVEEAVDGVTDPVDGVLDGMIEPLPDLPVDVPDGDDPDVDDPDGDDLDGVLGPSNPTLTEALAALVGSLPAAPAGEGGESGGSGAEASKPVNTSAPALSGGPRVGQTLACTRGAWSNNPTVYYAAWLRGNKLINGQNGLTYTLQAADAGNLIACSIIAGNSAGYGTAVSRTILAEPSGGADTARPVITGFKASPKRFKLRKGKTVLKWKLSEAAAVTIVIERRASGRYTRIGSISKRGKKGAGKAKFKGKVANRYVKPGRYRFTVTATDAAGNISKKRRASLRLRG